MAATTTNGTLTPPSPPPAPASPSLAKRKRTEVGTDLANGASPVAPAKPANGTAPSLQPTLEDIIEVLKRYEILSTSLCGPSSPLLSLYPARESICTASPCCVAHATFLKQAY
jgi:hypothetical protein